MPQRHPNQPNILFLMADQLQGRVFHPGHPCQTPNLDRLFSRGVRFDRAYTPNAICSPARASLMTGLLPHNHGVLTVTHCVDDDQSVLRPSPHWAQRLESAGYFTGYFGKWHVERSYDLPRYGWQVNGNDKSEAFLNMRAKLAGPNPPKPEIAHAFRLKNPGYNDGVWYGVTSVPPEQRFMGVTTALALEFLDSAVQKDQPWCCFVSVAEPHDPYICGREAFAKYDVDSLPLQPNVRDEMKDKPGMYRKMARAFSALTDRQKREAMACYYGSISEIDDQFARIIKRLEQSGQLDNTIIVLTADHGELLGSHGLYCKNIGAFEEVYNIPLLLRGPGIAQAQTSTARVGLHDLGPTLLQLAGLDPITNTDCRSFAPAARDPQRKSADFSTGYAEFNGTRHMFTQRIIWDHNWKFVHNGFDFDELYDLQSDPQELHNLAEMPEHQARVQQMMKLTWQRIKQTNDKTLLNTQYPACRLAPVGPGVLDTATK